MAGSSEIIGNKSKDWQMGCTVKTYGNIGRYSPVLRYQE